MFEKQNEVIIRAENLERSNLTVSDRLELHCLDYAVVAFLKSVIKLHSEDIAKLKKAL